MSRFNPVERHLRRDRSVKTFNHIVPRVGATYDLTGDGKTVLKANWGRFYFNPGVNLADAVNPNIERPVRGLQLERPQRRPRLPGRRAGAPKSRASAAPPARRSIRTWSNSVHRRSVVLPRARGARRPRRARRLRVEEGQRRLAAAERRAPLQNYNIPVTVVDPGPDGNAADDRRQRPELQPAATSTTCRGRATRSPKHCRLRGHLQDDRVLGQQALLRTAGR